MKLVVNNPREESLSRQSLRCSINLPNYRLLKQQIVFEHLINNIVRGKCGSLSPRQWARSLTLEEGNVGGLNRVGNCSFSFQKVRRMAISILQKQKNCKR
ncbi:Hypothetical predicted protein [Olea europaea subsp. europaea]|uniref:Uncharacterized protein n=1 Tax=Olea europaea subsp. europaea TaxID=158383 RepID=A0A8S0SV01_OLEEU|nr:Hypothetical predicted protein [Olea europaea subsp. europaea]